MPCGLTSNLQYPNYLKSVLKEIEVGNDETLKTAACKLKTPITTEGCVILDEDDKASLFPFCTVNTEEDPMEMTSDDPLFIKRYPVGFTPKELMEFFWLYQNYKISGSSSSTSLVYCDCTPVYPQNSSNCSICPYNKTTLYISSSITRSQGEETLQNKDKIKDVIKLFSENLSTQIISAPANVFTDGEALPSNPYPVGFYISWYLEEPCYIYEDKFYPNIIFSNAHEQWNSAFTENSFWLPDLEFLYNGKLNINTHNRTIPIDVYNFYPTDPGHGGKSTNVNLFMNDRRK